MGESAGSLAIAGAWLPVVPPSPQTSATLGRGTADARPEPRVLQGEVLRAWSSRPPPEPVAPRPPRGAPIQLAVHPQRAASAYAALAAPAPRHRIDLYV